MNICTHTHIEDYTSAGHHHLMTFPGALKARCLTRTTPLVTARADGKRCGGRVGGRAPMRLNAGILHGSSRETSRGARFSAGPRVCSSARPSSSFSLSMPLLLDCSLMRLAILSEMLNCSSRFDSTLASCLRTPCDRTMADIVEHASPTMSHTQERTSRGAFHLTAGFWQKSQGSSPASRSHAIRLSPK